MNIFRYEVTYFNENKCEEVHEKGILAAGSYVNAVMRLCHPEKGYGPDLIDIRVADLCEEIVADDELAAVIKYLDEK